MTAGRLALVAALLAAAAPHEQPALPDDGGRLPAALGLQHTLAPPADERSLATLRRTSALRQPEDVLDALAALVGSSDPRAVRAVLGRVAEDTLAIRPAARRVLASVQGEEALAVLLDEGLGHRLAHVRVQALLALAEGHPDGDGWQQRVPPLLDDEDDEVRSVAVRTLGRLRAGAWTPRLADLAADPSTLVRREVPGCLLRLGGRRCLPVLDALADDERWHVRLAVVAAWAELPCRESAARLAERLDHETGRLRADIARALVRLTGRNFAFSAEAWRRFVAAAPDEVFQRPFASEVVAPTSVYAEAQGVRRYHHALTASSRLLFLTDVSGSMESVCPDRDRSHIALARAELSRLVTSLDASVSFDLITFEGWVRAFRPHPVPADERTRVEALEDVARYSGAGATNLFDALRLAFDLAEAELLASPGTSDGQAVDTLFLLTDGEPTAGEITDLALLAGYVAERNRRLGLTVHGISFAHGPGQEWLQRLAESTGGTYTSWH